jgi:hypothetical protein
MLVASVVKCSKRMNGASGSDTTRARRNLMPRAT